MLVNDMLMAFYVIGWGREREMRGESNRRWGAG
jgi:hypothetical protein